MLLLPQLEKTVSKIDLEMVSSERREILQPMVDYIREKLIRGQLVRLNFICTHNSRRSHLSQVWAQSMAHYLGFDMVFCYSGGTESTAIYPMVADVLKLQGFEVETTDQSHNPVYTFKYSMTEPPIIGFSKKWDDEFNPQTGFAAVMTCSHAHETCPFIVGAEVRLPVTYEDPKHHDSSPEQEAKYAERSIQIASEMLYVFTMVGVGRRIQKESMNH